MSRFALTKKFLRTVGLTGVAGGVATSFTAPSFARSEETKTGVKVGVGVGLAAFAVPKLVRNKTLRAGVQAGFKVVFRRIRGRIRPIRVKK